MDIQTYLNRMNTTVEQPSLQYLESIQTKHLKTIPFENLDVLRHIPIYLNLNTIYEKIVMNGRGGYCYEVNGLLQWALNELNFDCHLVGATVKRPNDEWAKEHTHATIIVHLAEPYLVDVGFGALTPRVPVPLNGSEVSTEVGETYKIVPVERDVFDLKRASQTDVERTLYRFSTTPKKLADFHEGCVFNQVSKDSTFTHTDIISLFTDEGRITLKDHLLTSHTRKGPVEQELTIGEKNEILKKMFQIRLKES